MFYIVIDNGATYVYRDEDNMVMGFLVNHEGIKKIIESLPISRYFVAVPKSECEEISKEQAFMLYDLMMDYHKNRKEKNKNKEEDKKEKIKNKYMQYKI